MSNNLIHSLMIFLSLALWTGTVLFTWRLVFHSHAPKIRFSKNLHPFTDDPCCPKFQISLQNTGRRPMFNGEFRASLFLKDNHTAHTPWKEIPIPVNQYGGLIVKFPRIEPLEDQQNAEWQKITLETRFLESELKKGEREQKPISLEEILTEEAYIQASFSGYDMVNGSKKSFTSKKYKLHDLG